MIDQDEHDVSDAFVHSRARSGILTPASDNSLNLSDGAALESRKRKRDVNTMDDLLKDSFVVKPYPHTAPSKPRTLKPLLLLPRSQLPLSSLDITSSAKALPQSRLFETHVKILELEERMGTQPMVLVARLDDARTLYAVERESRGLYVLCQLGSWVNLQDLRAAAISAIEEFPRISKPGPLQVIPTKPSMDAALPTPGLSKHSRTKRLAIEAIQSMVKRPATGLSTESESGTAEPESMVDSQQIGKVAKIIPATPIDATAAPPTAAEIFENVRNQYLDALYLSKASLAYFAKGPLSRARAAFHLDYDSTLDLNDHVTFLESLVLSTSLIDKKYRDGIPTCVSMIDIQDHSAEDADHATAKSKKRRSSKVIKPGKNGLYPAEETLIRRWWASHDDDAESGTPGSSREEITKGRVAQLRIRETQLQMIVILEVLALKPGVTAGDKARDELPATTPMKDPAGGKEKPVKSKKADHLTILIDVHIDRLCIWQSISQESVKAPLGEFKIISERHNGLNPPKHTDNILKDFCVEVIAPFFSARLPDRCAIINRKLGGPVVLSPPSPKLSKSAIFPGAPSRPGAATKRPVPVKPRRTLQRVLTDDRDRRSISRGPNKAISLMRSATMPIVPGLKREASEAPSMCSIPSAESYPFEATRGGFLNSKRFSRREVDLSSLALDPQANKKVQIEAELREAILALKKPNRKLAGKAIAETAEKRSTSASQSKKSKKPMRNPQFQGVQILATPKSQRQKDMLAEPQLPDLIRPVEEVGWAVIPPSSLPRIPQSQSRASRDGLQTQNHLLSSVQATPTRKTTALTSQRAGGLLSAGPVDFDGHPLSSPLHMSQSSTKLLTTTPESLSISQMRLSFNGIEETPIRKKPVLLYNHPTATGSGRDRENERIQGGFDTKSLVTKHEESIYKSLGWDDADDVDDLA